MNFKRVMRAILTFALGTVFCATLSAQTGTISGTILDPSGSGVPEATITIKSLGTAAVRNAATDASGAYAIPNVLVGRYDITVEKQGFTSLQFSNVELTVGQNLTVNGSMTVGAVSEQVEVTGSAVSTIDLESAQISNIVDQKRILNLPLLTRDPYS